MNCDYQKLACSPAVCKDDMKYTLEQAMKEKGLETEIRNIVFHLMRNSIRNEHKLVSQNVSLVFIYVVKFIYLEI